jgi:hypothetical protein
MIPKIFNLCHVLFVCCKITWQPAEIVTFSIALTAITDGLLELDREHGHT